MGTPVPVVSGREAAKAFERLGWTLLRQRGSHMIYGKPDVPANLVVPDQIRLGVAVETRRWDSNVATGPLLDLVPMELEYASVSLKRLLEDWEAESGLYAPDMLCEHLEELFGAGDYTVVSARAKGSFLELQVNSSKWSGAFECLLDSVGKLWFDRRPDGSAG